MLLLQNSTDEQETGPGAGTPSRACVGETVVTPCRLASLACLSVLKKEKALTNQSSETFELLPTLLTNIEYFWCSGSRFS